MMKQINKILIIRFSSIGDIVLTTPVMRNIKRTYPNTIVHYLTKSAFSSVIECNPFVDKVFLYNNDLNALIKELQNENYDLIIDLHRNLRSKWVKIRLRTKSKSFYKLNLKKWLLVNLKWNTLPSKHIVDRYMDTLDMLGIENDGLGLDYFIAEQDEIHASLLPLVHHSGYVALIIGGKHKTKQMPAPKLTELCSKIPYPLVMLGGSEDVELAEEIITNIRSDSIYNACGKFNISQSASIVKQAKVVISNDTGLMHIAAAFKKKIISLWGNTVPDFGMYPYLPDDKKSNSIIEEIKGLNCRPCSKIGYKTCPRKHFNCMNLQNIDKIIEDLKYLYEL